MLHCKQLDLAQWVGARALSGPGKRGDVFG
jgi:hypothetical protein